MSAWVNRSVFMPMSMIVRREKEIVAYVVPIVATTTTIGLWHGFHFVWVLWAMHHALGLLLTDFFVRTGRGLRTRMAPATLEWLGSLSGLAGPMFIWAWLALSYCFTMTTNASMALSHYVMILSLPAHWLRHLLG